jgi:RNA polymerase sigma-70 factor (sigma-E family)
VDGFDAFVASRGAVLLRFAYLLSGDRHAAEDLVQSALAKAYRHWDRVSAAEHPEAYVRRIVVREHLSWRRLRSAGELVTADPAVGTVEDGGAVSGSNVANRDAAWRLLATLPRQQRAVLVLRFYEDLDDDAVARVLSCSPSTVRSNAARGLAALRRLVPTLDSEALP